MSISSAGQVYAAAWGDFQVHVLGIDRASSKLVGLGLLTIVAVDVGARYRYATIRDPFVAREYPLPTP